MTDKDIKFQSEYKYDFKDEDVSILKTAVGLSEDTIRQISAIKDEPEWMLDFRLKALKSFNAMPLPRFGLDLKFFGFLFIYIFHSYFEQRFSRLE